MRCCSAASSCAACNDAAEAEVGRDTPFPELRLGSPTDATASATDAKASAKDTTGVPTAGDPTTELTTVMALICCPSCCFQQVMRTSFTNSVDITDTYLTPHTHARGSGWLRAPIIGTQHVL